MASKVTKVVAQTIEDRQPAYGDFTVNAGIAQQLKGVLRENDGALTDVQRESLDMIMVKIGRILSGDANHADSWHDIAGYATLAEERCK